MGKPKKGGGSSTSKTSSGKRRMSRAKRQLMRVTMKIKRWERNKDNPEKQPPKWDKNQKVRKRSRHNKWDTSGLIKHAKLLQEIIERGIKA